jgi:lipopolysaccharide transport system permease protein
MYRSGLTRDNPRGLEAFDGGAPYRIAVTVGFLVALATIFVMHKYFTFTSRSAISVHEVVGFALVIAFNYALTLGIIELVHGVLRYPLLWAKTASLPRIPLWIRAHEQVRLRGSCIARVVTRIEAAVTDPRMPLAIRGALVLPSARTAMIGNLRELYQYRALVWSLTVRELRARYRGSVLGFFWTFLNPALLMLVYSLIFSVYMRQNLEHYAVFLFAGLLPWIWFSSSVIGGASTLSDRRDLLTKVRFPPQVLPATVVLTNGINFALSLPVMFGVALISGVAITWHALLIPVLALLQAVLTLGLVYFISALNVTFRDTQQIVGNVITFAFFLTPVLYPLDVIPVRYQAIAVYTNPMAAVVTAYQSLLYRHELPDPRPLLASAAVALVIFAVASSYFARHREEFAELV